jgi:ribosomal protein S18 acetylase RimI-like enzyme
VAVTLRPLTVEELSEFIDGDVERYVAERVHSGESPAVARRIALKQSADLFPGGAPGKDHLLFRVLGHDGPAVGTLWIGPHPAGEAGTFWVWDLQIDEAHRGNGYGRDAMGLAEVEARDRGATALGLNVFGHNLIARRLYESMGYEATSIRMKKSV